MSILDSIKSNLGLKQEKCQAIVGESTDCLCDDKVYGRGYTQGHEIKYCSKHIPSKAIPAGGRMKSVEFYISESDTTIEVN